MNLTDKFIKQRVIRQGPTTAEKEALIMPNTVSRGLNWIDSYQKVRNDIMMISQTLDKLESKQQQQKHSAFDQAQNQEVNQMYNRLQQQLSGANNDIKNFQNISITDGEFKQLHEPMIRSLRTALSRTSTRFRSIQSRFLESMAQDRLPNDQLDFKNMNEETKQYYRQIQSEVQDNKKEMESVCRQVNELVELVGQMCEKVYEAGSIIDRIDQNLSEAEQNFEEGIEKLEQARKTQKQVGCLRSFTYSMMLADVIMLIVLGVLKIHIPKKGQ